MDTTWTVDGSPFPTGGPTTSIEVIGSLANNGAVVKVVIETVCGNLTSRDAILTVNVTPCGLADLNEDGVLDFFDVSEFLTLYDSANGVPLPPPDGADFNGDGVLDFFDVSEFLTAFSSGCS